MARPRLWTSSAHALTVLVMLFQSMLFRRFLTSKGRERGLLSLKHPSDSNWTENDKKKERKRKESGVVEGGGGGVLRKTGDGTLLFLTCVQNLIKKITIKAWHSVRDLRVILIFVCEIPHLIWLLKGHLFFHHVFCSVPLTSDLYNPLLWYISLSH